jgi:ribonuclease HI
MKWKLNIKSGTTYTSYEATEMGRTSARLDTNQPSLTVTKMPTDSIPADLYQCPESTLEKFDMVTTIQHGNPPNELCKWRHDIFTHLQILDIRKLKQSLENKNIPTKVVSNGGGGLVHHYQSKFGLVIAAKYNVVARNKSKIYSIEFHESSYRSELYGLLAAVVSLRHIIKSYKITFPRQKEIFFYSDNKSVVNTINNRLELRRTVNQHRYPDVDIKLQLMHELHKLNETNCIINIQHVKGHQDSEKKRKLTIEESLNAEVDELTHEARALQNVKDYAKFPTNKVNFKLNNKYIISHYPKLVNLAFHSMALTERYIQKYNWTSKTIDSLWWPA